MRVRRMRIALFVAAAAVAAATVAYAWPDESPDPATAPFVALASPRPSLPARSRHLYSLATEGSTLSPETYAAIWEADRFDSPFAASHSVSIPDLSPVLLAQGEFLDRLSRHPDAAMARDKLEADLAFWRRALDGANVVAIKLAAIRAVERNLHTRARLARAHQEAGVLAGRSPIARLSIRERSFCDPLAFELAIDRAFMSHLDEFLRDSGQGRRVLAMLPFKRERTYNRHIAHNIPVLRMASLDAAELVRAYAARPRRLHTLGAWDYVINLKGVWALEMADASHKYGMYMLSGHDLDALIVLVNLAEDLARAGVPAAGARDFIARNPGQFGNPFVPGETAAVSADGASAYFPTRPGEGGSPRLRLALELRWP